ncbi:response regulator transcription factor [Neobacillus sp. SAB-20_R2A]|uniref:response regulator transcription factor n=1 Tax=Neobacillus sp. SAB-20_R2A TaxID=3120519 RepID=UPI003C6E55A4
MEKIRVLLVEDDEYWKNNISDDLGKEDDISLAGVVSTKEDALSALQSIEVDIILMDINLTANNLDGIEIARELKRTGGSSSKIIMLTSLHQKEIVMQSFKQGAVNFITKSSYQDIIRAIREAYYNRSAIHPDAAEMLRTEIILSDLTPMEREIYDLKQQGYNKTQISELLYKSVNTIKSQLRSIRDKLRG